MGLVSLCVSRAIVGLGEGFAPSAVTHVMASIVPQSERSRAVAYVFGGLDLGSVIGLLLCGPLIAIYGWPSVFYVFAILGLVWAVAWPLSKPGVVDDVMAKEKELDDVTGEIKRRDDAKLSGEDFVERTTEELDDVRKACSLHPLHHASNSPVFLLHPLHHASNSPVFFLHPTHHVLPVAAAAACTSHCTECGSPLSPEPGLRTHTHTVSCILTVAAVSCFTVPVY